MKRVDGLDDALGVHLFDLLRPPSDILGFIGKFTDILVNLLVIDHNICNILPCNNLTRLPIFFRGSSFRGITRSR